MQCLVGRAFPHGEEGEGQGREAEDTNERSSSPAGGHDNRSGVCRDTQQGQKAESPFPHVARERRLTRMLAEVLSRAEIEPSRPSTPQRADPIDRVRVVEDRRVRRASETEPVMTKTDRQVGFLIRVQVRVERARRAVEPVLQMGL